MFKYYFYLILGIIFGIAVSLIYLIGYPFAVRLIIPYAVPVVLLIFALTSMKILFCKCMWIGPYAKTIIITASIFLILAMLIIGTAVIPAGALKVFLTFVGATSFGITLMTYIGFIFQMLH
ncbi:MAG: hypothetical protein VB119_07500 [Candidatus Metalachnospira sp.]|nr:hypothetical protein [Candidatus Metalachnospira sp.]